MSEQKGPYRVGRGVGDAYSLPYAVRGPSIDPVQYLTTQGAQAEAANLNAAHAAGRESLAAEIARLKRVAEDVAQEAHTMGRVYARGGETGPPTDEFKRVSEMVKKALPKEKP